MWAAAANAILTSRDRGATWSVARFVDGDVALSVDPSNGNRGLAIVTQPLAASSEVPAPGLLRTLDAGASW